MSKTLWLLDIFLRGPFMLCAYAETPPTVMQPEPPIYIERAFPHGTYKSTAAETLCPLKIMYFEREQRQLPEDLA
ncbi:MAG: hypothetical protein QNJ97_17945 [Myxococcota bacterium]|nr:hypothetical protein [Myxococcota bacterium]